MPFTKPNRMVDRVFLHCSASDHANHDNVATMRDWHVNGNGWSDVGYHYFIRKNGTLENGRPLSRTPAAQAGHNKGTIAICLHGLHEERFTDAQFDRLKNLCLDIANAYNGQLSFHGHCEVAAKACPVFDYKQVLQIDDFGKLGLAGAPGITPDNETRSDFNLLPVLRRKARGETVRFMQKLLLIRADGIFGPKTEQAVRAFQTKQGLISDGIVGKNTWKHLLENQRIIHND